MASGDRGRRAAAAPGSAEVFDQAHLARYTMENPALEREIVGLFLQQLPATLDMLKKAETAAEWRLAAHTLKGSAAAVGATRINALAVRLERCGFAANAAVKAGTIAAVEAAIAEFTARVGRIYR
jgi:HPt (histidine-containing phosphotransfer) domain-containing protein